MSVGGKVGRRAMPIRTCAMYDASSPSILAPRRTRTDYHGAGTAGTVSTMVGTVESIYRIKFYSLLVPQYLRSVTSYL